MVKVEITKDGFMNGRNRLSVGDVIEVAPPIARYIVKNNEGKIIGEIEKPKKPAPNKKATKKKATYKTRDMKADDEAVWD